MIEKQVSFWEIIGRSEAFSEHRFQVSAQPPVKKTAGLIEKETFGTRFGNRPLLGFAFRYNNGKM
jgi:hypothetical protein